jgi:hypothetical protein
VGQAGLSGDIRDTDAVNAAPPEQPAGRLQQGDPVFSGFLFGNTHLFSSRAYLSIF